MLLVLGCLALCPTERAGLCEHDCVPLPTAALRATRCGIRRGQEVAAALIFVSIPVERLGILLPDCLQPRVKVGAH